MRRNPNTRGTGAPRGTNGVKVPAHFHSPPLSAACFSTMIAPFPNECGKGDRHLLCDDQRYASVPASGPFRQKVPVPFSQD